MELGRLGFEEGQAKIYDTQSMRYTAFCRRFSVVDPNTAEHCELGNIHCGTMDVFIPRSIFERTRKVGWPNDPAAHKLIQVMDEAGFDWRGALAQAR